MAMSLLEVVPDILRPTLVSVPVLPLATVGVQENA